jgi:hypothetical protein
MDGVLFIFILTIKLFIMFYVNLKLVLVMDKQST